jgi:ABC-type transport system involved in multi-copper enzyme maturation permease subunit
MTGVLRAEILKLRTVKTTLGLAAGMLALVSLLVLVHALALSEDNATYRNEMRVFGWGQVGVLFAALLGALSITGEYRTGVIRPTFLATPRRAQVLVAKVLVCAAVGAILGAASEALTIGLGSLVLAARGLPNELGGGDYAQLLTGGVVAAALWAPLGLGLGAALRNQVALLIGLSAWLLFVENVLIMQIPEAIRYFPGAAGAALSGATITGEVPTDPALLAPAVGALLLVAYAAAVFGAGVATTARRDVP